ncbi:MAG: DUF1592 domain-containing protein [Myxococcota bacterium]
MVDSLFVGSYDTLELRAGGQMEKVWAASSIVLGLFMGCAGEISEGGGVGRCETGEPGCEPPIRAACEDPSQTTQLALLPIRRLSETEYHNTMDELFAGVSFEAATLVPALTEGGFENFVSNTRQVGERDVEAFDTAIANVAPGASTDAAFLARHGCEASMNASACLEAFVPAFGLRALRRPLTAGEEQAYLELATELVAEIDVAAAIETVIASMLMTPEFLYRVERRGQEQAGPYEMASRLSYTLWQSMPDDALFEAAAANELRRPADIEAQAERMLADARAIEAIADFHRQWFRFSRMDDDKYAAKSPTLFPEWTLELRGAIQEGVRRYVRHIAESDTTLPRLLQDRTAFVNAELAELYGVGPVSDWTEVQLPADERSGILTRANFLAGTGIAGHGSPVHRGIFVFEGLLCQHLGGVPDDADTSVPAETPADQTTRELYEQITSPSECRGCHARINPIGFAFENYTSTGEFRTEEHGRPIDATGQLNGSEAPSPIEGAVQLSDAIAQSETAFDCASERWTAYLLGRRVDGDQADDACFTERLQHSFWESGGDMRALLLTFVSQPEFLGGAQ